MKDIRESVERLVARKLAKFCKLSDDVWEYAELKFNEFQSCKAHATLIQSEGFHVETGAANIPTAFVATFGEGKPVIGILGEYDALEGLSQQADSEARKPLEPDAPGHGCGHNLLGAAALGAAICIKDYMAENGLTGTVKYFGCPAEEGGNGKVFMVRAGLFDDVDIVLAWHPAQFNFVWDGADCLGILNTEYAFEGLAAHASSCPWLGRSALDAVELMNVGANYLREHVSADARIHYAITDTGGTATNIVQAHAKVLYTVRATEMRDVWEIAGRVDKIAEGAALMTGTTLKKRIVSGCSNLRVTQTVFDRLEANLKQVLPIQYSQEDLEYAAKFNAVLPQTDKPRLLFSLKQNYPGKSMPELEKMLAMPMANYLCTEYGAPASTDVGDVSWVVPTCQFHVACYPAYTPYHSWQMVAMGKSPLVHKGIEAAAKVIAMTALDFMTDEALVQRAKEDFRLMIGSDKYNCPVQHDYGKEDSEA
jgi:aminobenzoyl-glutamate utilization protein B